MPGNPELIRGDKLEELICDCLDLLLATLPPEQANLVRAIDVEGILPQSVADKLGLSLNEVTTHLVLGKRCPDHTSAYFHGRSSSIRLCL